MVRLTTHLGSRIKSQTRSMMVIRVLTARLALDPVLFLRDFPALVLSVKSVGLHCAIDGIISVFKAIGA